MVPENLKILQIRGKGFDPVTTARDYNLLAWIGANAYRTSHYPYDEKIMDKADEQGFLILDECPAVNVECVRYCPRCGPRRV